MRTFMSLLIVNLGTVARVLFILTICLFCWFGMPSVEGTGETVLKLSITGMVALFISGIFCAVSSVITYASFRSHGNSFLFFLMSTLGYLYLVYGSDYAMYFGTWSQVALPVLIAVLSLIVAIFGVREFEDIVDLAFLVNASAVDYVETRIGYFFNRFFECWNQCFLFALTIDLCIVFYATQV